MEKRYKITNYSEDTVSIYNSKNEQKVMKPRVSVIVDNLPAPRPGLLVEELNDKDEIIRKVDVAFEKAKEEILIWNKENKEQRKLFEHIKPNGSKIYKIETVI